MNAVRVKNISHVWNNRKRVTVIFVIPTEATPFNGYKNEREEVVTVYGQTAEGIIRRVEKEGCSTYAPANSNVNVLTPNHLTAWFEE